MPKTITLRLSDKEYKQISTYAENEHRPISNFITHVVLKAIEKSVFVDPIEMAEINSNKKLKTSLQKAHKDAKQKKGKFVD